MNPTRFVGLQTSYARDNTFAHPLLRPYDLVCDVRDCLSDVCRSLCDVFSGLQAFPLNVFG